MDLRSLTDWSLESTVIFGLGVLDIISSSVTVHQRNCWPGPLWALRLLVKTHAADPTSVEHVQPDPHHDLSHSKTRQGEHPSCSAMRVRLVQSWLGLMIANPVYRQKNLVNSIQFSWLNYLES